MGVLEGAWEGWVVVFLDILDWRNAHTAASIRAVSFLRICRMKFQVKLFVSGGVGIPLEVQPLVRIAL